MARLRTTRSERFEGFRNRDLREARRDGARGGGGGGVRGVRGGDASEPEDICAAGLGSDVEEKGAWRMRVGMLNGRFCQEISE